MLTSLTKSSIPSRNALRESVSLLPVLTLAAGLSFTTQTASASEILPLKESKLMEVINDVKILQGDDLDAVAAEQEMIFRSPDFLETGRRSRARMQAEDGTITRVGSNTLFSFDQVSRTINLKKGSLLFHSPEGKGGGRVVTASATASVIGTTIMTVSTPDGGFKVLVLEGTARVDFLDGTSRILSAGQMTFILPGEGSQKGPSLEGAAAGRPGPVLNFDLSRLRAESNLLNGFGDELPSTPKIEKATKAQLKRISDGDLDSTDALIIRAEDEESIVLKIVDKELQTSSRESLREPPEDPDPIDPEVARLIAALESSIMIGQGTDFSDFTISNFFDYPGVTLPADALAQSLFLEGDAFGFLADEIEFIDGTLDVSPITLTMPDAENTTVLLAALSNMSFIGRNTFTGFTGETTFVISALDGFTFNSEGELLILSDTVNSSLAPTSANESGTSEPLSEISTLGSSLTPFGSVDLELTSNTPIVIPDFEISNDSGSIFIFGNTSIDLTGSHISAGGSSRYYPDSASTSFSEIESPTDTALAPFGNIELSSFGSITIEGAELNASGFALLSSDSTVTIDGIEPPANSSSESSGYIERSYITGFDVFVEADGDISISNTLLETNSSSSELPVDDSTLVHEAEITSGNGNVSIQDDTSIYAEVITIGSTNGDVEISDSDVYIYADDLVKIDAGTTVRINNAEIGAEFIELSGENIILNGVTLEPYPYDGDIGMIAAELAELYNVDLTSFSTINIEGRTLALSDLIFPDSGTIRLGSEMGMLAPNPNTGATAITGYVNFINNVTVSGAGNAEFFVPYEQGGMAEELTHIEIYATGE